MYLVLLCEVIGNFPIKYVYTLHVAVSTQALAANTLLVLVLSYGGFISRSSVVGGLVFFFVDQRFFLVCFMCPWTVAISFGKCLWTV